MRLLVLGTSNSVLRTGWVAGLREALPESTIDNRSLGASPGSQFGCYLGEDFSRYDIVFVDSVPNDEQISERKVGTAYNDRLLFEIISTIASQTRVIVIGFTNSHNLNSETSTYRMRRRIAGACGAQFIDTREIVLKMGRNLLDDQTELYEHPSHPHRDISRAIGYELGQAITSLSWTNVKFHKNVNYSSNFRSYDPVETVSQEKIALRHNSLIKMTCAELVPGDEVLFSDHGVCVGFYVEDFIGTALQLTGNGKPPVLMRYRYKPTRGKFEIIFNQLWDWAPLNKVLVLQGESSEGEISKAVLSKFLFWSSEELNFVPKSENFDVSILQRQIERSLKINCSVWRQSISVYRSAQSKIRDTSKEEAYRGLREALLHFPDHFEALYDLARVCSSTARLVEAESIYSKLRSLRPDDLKILRESTQVLVRLNRHEEALDLLKAGLLIDTENPMLINDYVKISIILKS